MNFVESASNQLSQLKSPPPLVGYTPNLARIKTSRENGELILRRLRLETNYGCNLRCRYCYATCVQNPDARLMTFEEQKMIIDQGLEFGLESVIILGPGEPMLWENLENFVLYLRSKNVTPVIFSNLTLITPDLARFFYKNGVSIMGKCDGPKEVQDYLCCENGVYDRIQNGLNNLKDAGFGQDPDNIRLGLNYVVVKDNLPYVENFWRKMREDGGIFPSVEQATIIGRAEKEMEITSEERMLMTRKLHKIDQEYGISTGLPYSALLSGPCSIFDDGMHVRRTGDVCGCPELPPVDSISEKSIGDILRGPEFVKIRNFRTLIQGKCGTCLNLESCGGGCRSKAYQNGEGNSWITSPDPFCGVKECK